MATAAFALAGVFWPLNAGADSSGGAVRFVADHSVARSSSLSGHLYVLDLSKSVYRFPLAPDGLPAIQPDGVLYPVGAVGPKGLAVDKVGHVFLADPDQQTVSEFAAGATGQQKPISILNLSPDFPDRLNIDDSERLYVHLGTNQDIAIFAKGAHGHDAPISIESGNRFATDYVIAKSGVLYVLNTAYAVGVYNKPLNNPSQPDWLIWPDGGYHNFSDTLALDETTNRLYIQFDVCCAHYWDKVNYDVRPPSGAIVASAWQPWIYTGDCGPMNNYIVGGTVIIKNYLIVSCNYSQGVVFVYRTDQFGRQRAPVETVGQGTLCCPYEMAVGP
jgi:hypothetical protein